MSITVYNNAKFDPINNRYIISISSPISSANACLCKCYNNVICFTAAYFNINQTCVLFSAQLSQGQLSVVPTIVNTKVYYLGNQNSTVLQIPDSTNDTVYAIWNTTAGGNSLSATPGGTMGTYWPTEPPSAAFDGDLTTIYTNHGNCDSSFSFMSLACGENTGLYLTLHNGPITLVGFYFVTTTYYPERDPLTITIEGSNLSGTALILGSSWTLIYNGSSGLATDPGRSTGGIAQTLSTVYMPYQSYRLLITSKRGNQTCTSYAEFIMVGY